MGSRFQQPPVTTGHHTTHNHLGLRQDVAHHYSSSFDEDTDEEIFDGPLHQYEDAFPGDPALQMRPALAEAGGPRVYYASQNIGGSSSRNNFIGASSINAAGREASHLTASNSNRLAEGQSRSRGPPQFGERRGDADENQDKCCLGEVHHDGEVSASQQREETQDSRGPSFVAVDVGGKKPRKLEGLPTVCAENTFLKSARRNNNKWSKLYNENPNEAAQIAEEAFSKVKFWREVFSALTGMHGVYVLANFAFDNPAGGICSLFCFLCSAFAQVDRRAPSYFLTALLSFCFGIVVAVSVGTPVRGFEAFSNNLLLRRICITQACLLLLATPVAILVALRIIELHSFLREPGVLIPLDCTEETAEENTQKNTQETSSETSEHTNYDPNTRKEPTASGSQDDANSQRSPSFEGNDATT
ncbi:hypothetical protein, conserved [Eimeria acervulina]|uniref:Transmembrane protein n=1 Tax=Eimeria acervulina TaxID=5801 RepID=U6GV27_EIMAC|nr:hypothetical protein, conserved [Eimeria acervulina]CDI84010.1 hypothetical protein, conserved [Eimeria acervulina]